ncbi:hypothetical protein M0L20_25605 [Spirosoma sp. RP8]|uniref:Uncharacterized protein n=1 Tax=Spirosoma liriopis TaxID=2937440 RepID=A0ABT0HSX4_9BACT|nr:hypothetical protein [Spirosoma liriopis]MCK8495271.1 hypothetical protein [Spirosoma liriopis]
MKTIKHVVPSSAKESPVVKKILDDKRALREQRASAKKVSSSETKPDQLQTI